MAKVFNWQLGREMDYPYEARRPERQFAMVFDTNKCIACQTCTVACKTTWTSGRGQEYMYWNNVETKPYGYYPLGWDVNILDRHGVQPMDGPVYQGKTLFDAAPGGEVILGYLPDDLDYAHPNIGEDDSTGLMPRGAHLTMPHMQWMFYQPRICNHCTYPACLSACPRQSIYKRQEDGIVLLDQSRCRGYRECVKACPYKKVFYNPMTGTSEKCIACFPKFEQGLQPQCFVNCIGKIRFAGHVSTPAAARASPGTIPISSLPPSAAASAARYSSFSSANGGAAGGWCAGRPRIPAWPRTRGSCRRCNSSSPRNRPIARCSAASWTGNASRA